jgi:hypothetical protein
MDRLRLGTSSGGQGNKPSISLKRERLLASQVERQSTG